EDMPTKYGLTAFGLVCLLSVARPLSAQVANLPVVDLLDTINGQTDVFYLGTDQHLHQLYFDGGWHHTDVTASTGADIADSMSPLDALLDPSYNPPDVFYIGRDGHVPISYFDGTTWHAADATAAAGAMPPLTFSPLASLQDTIHATPDVFYIGTDQHV